MDEVLMETEWRFGVVGNIVPTHQDEHGKTLYGTKEFTGGTKVYIDGKNWYNYPRTQIVVIGLNRFKKYSIASVSPELIENVRFQLIRRMQVLNIIENEAALDGWHWWGKTSADKKEARYFVENWEAIKKEAAANSKISNTE